MGRCGTSLRNVCVKQQITSLGAQNNSLNTKAIKNQKQPFIIDPAQIAFESPQIRNSQLRNTRFNSLERYRVRGKK